MLTKKLATALFVFVILVALTGAAYAGGASLATIRLKGNQTITVYCDGDEILIDPYSDGQAIDVTCRVWLVAQE